MIIYWISSYSKFTSIKNSFKGALIYDADLVLEYLQNSTRVSTTPMYFSGSSIEIISNTNKYENFYLNSRGGVYNFEGAHFTEETSTYKNNSALLGGVMSCNKCKISTISNEYESNLANEGGVLYIESDSELNTKFD